MALREMAVRYRFDTIEQGELSNGAIHDTWHDPRVASLFIEEVEVVGIEYHRDKLINWLVERPSSHTVISVVGIGGVGKTTLVKKVCDNENVVEHFDCSVWITVSIIQLGRAIKGHDKAVLQGKEGVCS